MKIEIAIINALKNVGMPSNITPILADRDGVEPSAPYLIIQTITTSKINMPTKSIVHKEGNVVETVLQLKEFDYALTFHASTQGDTHDWVEYFHSGLDSDMVDYAFTQQGLSIVRADEIMYQPQPVEGNNYKRAIINITFRAEVLNEYTVNAMKGVSTVGDIIDSLAGKVGEVVVDVDFTK